MPGQGTSKRLSQGERLHTLCVSASDTTALKLENLLEIEFENGEIIIRRAKNTRVPHRNFCDISTESRDPIETVLLASFSFWSLGKTFGFIVGSKENKTRNTKRVTKGRAISEYHF
eukprot:478700-Amphidinium_carterae.1